MSKEYYCPNCDHSFGSDPDGILAVEKSGDSELACFCNKLCLRDFRRKQDEREEANNENNS